MYKGSDSVDAEETSPELSVFHFDVLIIARSN